jgi:Transmembrane protein 43
MESSGNDILTTSMAVLLAICLLFWNEGRVNVTAVAKTATDVAAIARPEDAQGKFVSVTGAAIANTPLGDGLFLLPGNYVMVDRTVEMYAWEQEKHTDSDDKTTYTYDAVWTNSPADSSNFHHSANHQNPPKAIPDQLFAVPSVQIDRYTLPLSGLNQVSNHRRSCVSGAKSYSLIEGVGVTLPESGSVQLTPQNSQVTGTAIRTPDYIFQGSGRPQNPDIGDLRVCYTVLPVGETVTAFGQLAHTQIQPYFHRKQPIHRLIAGTRPIAIALLGLEELLWRWLLRLFGFGLMWWGLYAMGAPVVAFLHVMPWVADITKVTMIVGSLALTLGLSTITILIAWLVYYPLLLFSGLAVVIGIGFVLWGRR